MNVSQLLSARAAVALLESPSVKQFSGDVESARCEVIGGSIDDDAMPDVIYHPADLAALVGTTRADGCVYGEPWGDKEIAEFHRMRCLDVYSANKLEEMRELFNKFKSSFRDESPEIADNISGFKILEAGVMKMTFVANTFDAMTKKMLDERLNLIPGLSVLVSEHSSVVLQWAKSIKEKHGGGAELVLSDLAGVIDYGAVFSEAGGVDGWSSSWKSQVRNGLIT